MPTLVEKLQLDAIDKNVPVSDLLRRVKLTATKLGLGVVEDWVQQELNGYQTKPPDYRMVHGTPKFRNPIHGWLPMGGSVEMINRVPSFEAVSSLERLLSTNDSGSLHITYPDKLCEQFDKMNNVRGWNYALEIPAAELWRILDRVRTLVLDWALALEKAGIMGSELNFDAVEKEKAQSVTTTITIGSIGTFAGNLGQGNVAGDSTIKIEQARDILDQLKPHIEALIAAGADATLAAKLEKAELALKLPDPAPGVLRGMLVDIRNAMSGAVGNLMATGAISALNALLGTGVPMPP